MAREKINMASVAKIAGTSIMTVSRALSPNGICDPKTRTKIERIAQRIGYLQNKLGVSFARDRLDTVGIVVPNIIHAFFPRVVNSIEEALAKEGYNVFLCCSRDNPKIERAKVKELLEYRVAGIIMLPSLRSQLSKESAEMVIESKTPLVMVDRIIPKIKCDTVAWKSSTAMEEIVSDLLARKRKRLVYICGESNEWKSRGRTRGFFSALKKRNLKDFAVLNCENFDEVKENISKLFSSKIKPDAICCATDILADEVFQVLKSLKIRVPHDVALTGFGGIINNHNTILSITTAYQDAELMGREAAHLMLKHLKNHHSKNNFENVKIPLRVDIRESSGAR